MPRMNLGRVRDKLTRVEKVSSTEEVDTYKLYSELNPSGLDGTFTVTNGIGQPAGFGGITYETETVTGNSGSSASAMVVVTASGPNTAKNFDFSFSFSIPKGSDGVITESSGVIGFQVIDGVLYASTADDMSNVSINENGELVYTYGS